MSELTQMSDQELERAQFDARIAYAMATKKIDAILALLDEIEERKRQLMEREREEEPDTKHNHSGA
jgi:hypothetical protein